MHIRRAQASDLPACADIVAAALCDEELIAYLCPRRREYWDEYRDSALRRIKRRFYSPGWVLWVAVTDEKDGEEEGKVVGYAAWHRIGEGEEASRWKKSVAGGDGGWLWMTWCGFQHSLVTLSNRIIDAMDLDPSLDRERLAAVEALVKDNFPSSIFPEMWYLATLVVDPSYQRRGIGKLLLQWAIEQATEERVPIGLEASSIGEKLYEKMGFRSFKWIEFEKGSTKKPVMLWEPEALHEDESWFERARRAARQSES
ncbi:hypothetical protein VTO42DRAFT_1895 [Malbranchea cinnamomea]